MMKIWLDKYKYYSNIVISDDIKVQVQAQAWAQAQPRPSLGPMTGLGLDFSKAQAHSSRLSEVRSGPGPGQIYRTWTRTPRFGPHCSWTWTWTASDPGQRVRVRSSPVQDLALTHVHGSMNITLTKKITILNTTIHVILDFTWTI